MTVAASPGAVSAFGPGQLTSNSTTATPTGGTPSYTYAWAQTSGDTLTITSPSAATTAFRGTPPSGLALEGNFACTVTDANGRTAVSGPVSVTLEGI